MDFSGGKIRSTRIAIPEQLLTLLMTDHLTHLCSAFCVNYCTFIASSSNVPTETKGLHEIKPVGKVNNVDHCCSFFPFVRLKEGMHYVPLTLSEGKSKIIPC